MPYSKLHLMAVLGGNIGLAFPMELINLLEHCAVCALIRTIEQ